jgi:hypothetical protein
MEGVNVAMRAKLYQTVKHRKTTLSAQSGSGEEETHDKLMDTDTATYGTLPTLL